MVPTHLAIRGGVAGLVLAATLTIGAPVAQAQSPAPSPAPSVAPDPSAAPTLAIDPDADLWFVAGDTIRRIDGSTGELTATLDLADPLCPIGPDLVGALRPAAGALWVANNDPDVPCIKGVRLDGTDVKAYSIAAPGTGRLIIGDVLETADGVWLVTGGLDEETLQLADFTLWHLDLASGLLELVAADTTGLAESDGRIGTYHVVTAKQGYVPALLDGAARTLTPLKGGAAQEPTIAGMLRSGGGRLVFHGPFGGSIQVLDPRSGKLSSVKLPKGVDGITGLFPSDGGLLFGGTRNRGATSFLRFQPWKGKAVTIPDPCRKQHALACVSFPAGATPGAAWVLSGPTLPTGGFDWSGATLTRIDLATRKATARIPGTVIVGPPATPSPSASPAP